MSPRFWQTNGEIRGGRAQIGWGGPCANIVGPGTPATGNTEDVCSVDEELGVAGVELANLLIGPSAGRGSVSNVVTDTTRAPFDEVELGTVDVERAVDVQRASSLIGPNPGVG